MPRRETRCGAIWRTTRPKPVLRPTASHATCLITQPNATLLREPSLFYARGPVAAFIMALRGHGYSLPLSHVYACLFPAYRYTTFEMASRAVYTEWNECAQGETSCTAGAPLRMKIHFQNTLVGNLR